MSAFVDAFSNKGVRPMPTNAFNAWCRKGIWRRGDKLIRSK